MLVEKRCWQEKGGSGHLHFDRDAQKWKSKNRKRLFSNVIVSFNLSIYFVCIDCLLAQSKPLNMAIESEKIVGDKIARINLNYRCNFYWTEGVSGTLSVGSLLIAMSSVQKYNENLLYNP